MNINPLESGIAQASGGQESEQRRKHVKSLMEAVENARKFDESARKQYARDRRYARGDSSFTVDSNVIGTFIEVLTAFLFARNPDADILPSESAVPPEQDAIMEAAKQQAAMHGVDPLLLEAAAQESYKSIRARYAKRQRDNKAFSETLQIVVTRLWKDAKLKRQCKRWVRSCLTIGVGWLKASWQTRTAADPIMSSEVNDMKDNIARIISMRADLDDPSACAELDAKRQQYEQAMKGLEENMSRVIARGFVVDMVPAEDIQVAIEVPSLSEYSEAPWIAHRSYLSPSVVKATFQLTEEQLSKAARYAQRKPTIAKDVSPAIASDITAAEADQYEAGVNKSYGECFRVEEIWHRDDNRVYTIIEGLDDYAIEPWTPQQTSRFYPFFLFATSETDGQRHPQSLTSRSYRLVDEYARVRSNYAEHRLRTRPKTAFNAAAMDESEASKLAGATTQEMVPLRLTNPAQPVGDVLQPITYAALDPMLYETGSIMAELERIWGIQEALSQSISTAKTATEAEIQHVGFQARTGSMRDALEDALSEVAQYTAEVALLNMSRQDAQHMAGDDAFWPEGVTAQEMATLVNVDIRAGSSGRPNTTAEREAWTALLPLLQESIQMIAQLRQSTPQDHADKLESLLRETAQRAGERLDIERLIPQAGLQQPMQQQMQPEMPPTEPMPGAVA